MRKAYCSEVAGEIHNHLLITTEINAIATEQLKKKIKKKAKRKKNRFTEKNMIKFFRSILWGIWKLEKIYHSHPNGKILFDIWKWLDTQMGSWLNARGMNYKKKELYISNICRYSLSDRDLVISHKQIKFIVFYY